MEGIERLEAEVLEMNDYNVSEIFKYLKTRSDLQYKFNNSEKSIKEMYDYICKKARKQMKNNVAMIQDNVVYLWAVNYFLKSNEELEIKKVEKVKLPPVKEIKKEEKVQVAEKENDSNNQISMFE